MKLLGYKEFNLNLYRKKQQLELAKIEENVKEIIDKIKKEKNRALFRFALEFDNTDLKKIGIKENPVNFEKAYKRYLKKDRFFIESLQKSISRIKRFHLQQQEKSFFITDSENGNEIIGQIILPLERVCIYIPGGKALYPSTVIMNVIPAQIAGVKEIYITTPVKNNRKVADEILVTLYLLGLTSLYRIGGAHSIAAFAYGTESVPSVDKICGPGNIYVTTAKKLVYGDVDIDMIAGPTEIVIIADDKANPEFIALDLLAQAEHDEMASPVLITDSKKVFSRTCRCIKRLLKQYKNTIAEVSINNNGIGIIVDKIGQAIEIANRIAPEHLELMVENPFDYLPLIKNAGSLFLGEYSPESVGDYIAGPNHTLPTMGTARFYSQLGVYSFVKRMGVTYFSKRKLKTLQPYISKIARKEKLIFHSLSARRV